MHEHLTRLDDDLPQPTLSEAHILWVAISKLRSGCASACMELTTIRHLRWHFSVKHDDELKLKLKRKPFPIVNT